MGRKPAEGETRTAVITTTWYPSEKEELEALAFRASGPGERKSMTDLIREAVYKSVFKRPMPEK